MENKINMFVFEHIETETGSKTKWLHTLEVTHIPDKGDFIYIGSGKFLVIGRRFVFQQLHEVHLTVTRFE